jgi:hypothetical protein
MGGLGHSKVFSAWGIPSPSYIKSSRSHTTMVQTLLMDHTYLSNGNEEREGYKYT